MTLKCDNTTRAGRTAERERERESRKKECTAVKPSARKQWLNSSYAQLILPSIPLYLSYLEREEINSSDTHLEVFHCLCGEKL